MNTQNQTLKTEFSIHPATQMGHVSLNVANLENQITFYTAGAWLPTSLARRQQGRARRPYGDLTTGGADLIRLTEEPNLKRYRGTTGLYHVAILFPNRQGTGACDGASLCDAL